LLGFTSGAMDYITKPFHPVEVWVRVENHMVRQWLQKELRRKNQNLEREIQERQKIQSSLQDANQRLERLSHMDSLTCAANRRAFDEYYPREWHRAIRDQQHLSLLLCDVDFFKRFNDHYGHVLGDSCLQMVAVALQDSIKRPADFLARYGGEEFVIVLPNTNLAGAMVVARHVQENLQRQGIHHEYSDVSHFVTLSIGAASCIPTIDSNMMSLVVFTDQCLYNAKHTGRNRIYGQEFVAPVEGHSNLSYQDRFNQNMNDI
ncbi:MAG: diguanylate cyclase, partial [Pseudanabaena sp. ELA607]